MKNSDIVSMIWAIAVGALVKILPPLPRRIDSTVVAPKVSRKNRTVATQNTGLRNW
ncbi:hypothetical protein [Blastomonas fulva]|nr:hypothetical protein [Blastomonas fulva]